MSQLIYKELTVVSLGIRTLHSTVWSYNHWATMLEIFDLRLKLSKVLPALFQCSVSIMSWIRWCVTGRNGDKKRQFLHYVMIYVWLSSTYVLIRNDITVTQKTYLTNTVHLYCLEQTVNRFTYNSFYLQGKHVLLFMYPYPLMASDVYFTLLLCYYNAILPNKVSLI